MTKRERLIELIHNSQYEYDGTKAWYEQCADYLLANGVIVPPSFSPVKKRKKHLQKGKHLN